MSRGGNRGNQKNEAVAFFGATPDGWNTTYKPIFFAARNGQSDAVEFLLSEGVDVNSIGAWSQTPLTEAVSQGHTATATLLLDRGAKPCIRDFIGASLWHATIANRVEMVNLLMKHGAGDCSDAESALSLAVENAQTGIVSELLAGGVDPVDVSATHLVLPLTTVARRNGDQETLKLLKAAGAK
ncbi:MAG: ankyrin repeat domain-containing protein [Pyrinomonadaceae bacterium]